MSACSPSMTTRSLPLPREPLIHCSPSPHCMSWALGNAPACLCHIRGLQVPLPGGCSGAALVLVPLCRNLLANPFNCNCQLAWLGDWLRKRKIVTGNPRCQNPDFLRQIPLQDVAFPDFRCEEGNSWALQRQG